MREKASQQDAQDVVEIMKYSLLDTFSDDIGNLDFQRSQHGSGMSSRAQVRQLTYPKQRIEIKLSGDKTPTVRSKPVFYLQTA